MIKRKKKPCKKESGKECYYFSRKFGCEDCTKEAKNLEKSTFSKKRTKAIKRISKKQAQSNKAVSLAKLRVMNDWIMEHGYMFCSSCGTRDGYIDMSHLIPISENKSLEGKRKNILPQCRDKCHRIQESGLKEMKNFNNYDEIMSRIKDMDIEYYRRLFIKHNS